LRRLERAHHLLPRILPFLAIGLVAHAAGEVAGNTRGLGDASRQLAGTEFKHHES
jgi:hypothetical protein